jgi:hypothetical protein
MHIFEIHTGIFLIVFTTHIFKSRQPDQIIFDFKFWFYCLNSSTIGSERREIWMRYGYSCLGPNNMTSRMHIKLDILPQVKIISH